MSTPARPGASERLDTLSVVRPLKARPTGLAVAALGIVVFNIAPFLDWVESTAGSDTASGYETDSLVPFIAYLGIGLLIAMAYAYTRARRGQHRGLTLTSLAIAIAAALQCIAFAIDPMGNLERGSDLDPKIGVYVGLIGALIWAIGSFLLAKDVEGDDEDRAPYADDTALDG
jgi:uncharacterized membrane protein YidH (DUF202 family)